MTRQQELATALTGADGICSKFTNLLMSELIKTNAYLKSFNKDAHWANAKVTKPSTIVLLLFQTTADARVSVAGDMSCENALHEMKITLMRLQLRRGHVLNSNCVVSSIGNDGIAMGVVMGCREQRVQACKEAMADLNGVGLEREVCEGDLSKIRCEDECIVAHRKGVDDLGLGSSGLRIDDASAAAVIRKFEAVLRIGSEEL